MRTTLSNTLLFFVEKCENLLQFAHFSTKNNSSVICDIYFKKNYETLTNDIVNFKQPGKSIKVGFEGV